MELVDDGLMFYNVLLQQKMRPCEMYDVFEYAFWNINTNRFFLGTVDDIVFEFDLNVSFRYNKEK
jgi:hypothetical protein